LGRQKIRPETKQAKNPPAGIHKASLEHKEEKKEDTRHRRGRTQIKPSANIFQTITPMAQGKKRPQPHLASKETKTSQAQKRRRSTSPEKDTIQKALTRTGHSADRSGKAYKEREV